jgi:hypothetical protein
MQALAQGQNPFYNATKAKENIGYRYIGETEKGVIEKDGKVPLTNAGGKEKPFYYTDDIYSNDVDAQSKLALPRTPKYRVSFDISGFENLHQGIVKPNYGQYGGGYEYLLSPSFRPIIRPIRIEPLNQVPRPIK